MVLTDSDLASIETPQDAERLAHQYLPDLGREDAGYFFRPAEQQLLTYAVISVIQGDIRQVDRLQALLVQDVSSLSDQFKRPQSPELQAYADALALLSPPRLMHAQWGLSKILGL